MENDQPKRKYRVVFAGSPAYAIPSLEAVLGVPGVEVVAVLSQRAKPRGRGNVQQASAVATFAEKHNLLTLTPDSLRTSESYALIASLRADIGVVVAYGKILPQTVLELLPHGWINAHASLLPRWRGASPIQQAILAGDVETGVSLMQLDAGMDTGPVFTQQSLAIESANTAQTLAEKLAQRSGDMLRKHLWDILTRTLPAQPQPPTGITMAPQLKKTDAQLHFFEPATALLRKVRAYDPWPGTYMVLHGTQVKILAAKIAPGKNEPGKVLSAPSGFAIATPEDVFVPLRVQVPGKKPVSAAEFARGYARLLQ